MRFPDELWTAILKINKRRAIHADLTRIHRATKLMYETDALWTWRLVSGEKTMIWHLWLPSTRGFHWNCNAGYSLMGDVDRLGRYSHIADHIAVCYY